MEGRQLASPSVDAHGFQQQLLDDFGDRLLEPLFSPPQGSSQMSAMSKPTTSGDRSTPWRRDEHARFVQALEAFGTAGDIAWAQIAAFVGSRSVADARRHGQHYLAQLIRQPARSSAFDWVVDSLSDGLSDVETPTGSYCSQNDPGNTLSAFCLGSDALQTALKPRKMPSVRAFPPPALGQQQQPQQRRTTARRGKVWTFQEDKAFETALAGWTSDKPYSWAKIAAALPGKSARDVRSRYEKLLGDVSSIEGSAFSSLSLAGDVPALRQRPPPIDITVKSSSSNSSNSSSSHSNTLRSAAGLLSPTLFDLLDASDGGEQQPLAVKREPKEDGATPRVWREFLADAFKFDETRVAEAPAASGDGGQEDVEMTSE
jgi:hypothetical protein